MEWTVEWSHAAAMLVGVGAAAYLGSSFSRFRSDQRYKRATRGEIQTRSFTPGCAALPYRRAKFLCSDAEHRFYLALLAAVGEDYTVMFKMRAASLINCTREEWRAGYGAPIAQKELDFVLVKPRTSFAAAAVELDDRSHELPERQERDRFLDEAFRVAGIPLIRVKCARSYDVAALRAHVMESILRHLEGEPNEQRKQKEAPRRASVFGPRGGVRNRARNPEAA